MKNLFEPPTAEEVRKRIARLRPDSPRYWGKMTSAQMAAHVSAFFEMALGDTHPPRMFIGRLIGPIAKWFQIRRENQRMLRNTPTVPGYAIDEARDLQKERERLRALVDRFAVGGPAAVTTHPHSFFGRLTPDEWSVLMYKHLDHHLRQFGV
jgi:uncharacterized protein DUF1569